MAENVGVYSGPTAGAKAATEALGFAVSPSSIDYWRLDFPGWAKEQPVLITPEALADQMERLYNQMIDLAKLVKENAIAATERFQNVEAEVAKHEQRLAEFARDVLTEDLTPVVWTGAENAPKGS
jgi:hypothetical protein